MPRYYFDVLSRSGLVCQDFQGLECRDDAAALAVARHGAGFTSHDDCARNPQLTHYLFSVADAAHRPLFTVPFTELEPDQSQAPRRRRGAAH
ncbi:DUF6894 family protein [Methylobacterium nodulans]|uniref:DUF6894 domain-containing protein n=1 Tax=Methylobacterium nodulans (strain LMG 21967 / CNCM I-2342 / ORS 2060) TaxID=460265 RepID=B8IU85_METNO|nr:hypothetical protein [Methylobacterium nodulans]ACL55130.1 conserved hypothetical protein [Methylobacterium nodulans ORS 2060]